MPTQITSLDCYFRRIAKLKNKNSLSQLYYRGHSDRNYKIEPTVFRQQNHRMSEHEMIRDLLAEKPREFLEDNGIFDCLVRAQHYDLPTRLLDVSSNPLVALYFAVRSNPCKQATVVVFKQTTKMIYFDSDVVACLSALSLMPHEKKLKLAQSACGLYTTNDLDIIINERTLKYFNALAETQELVQIVSSEKPSFKAIIHPKDLLIPVAVMPRKLHQRIIAQHGAFLIFGFGEFNSQNLGLGTGTEKIPITQDIEAEEILIAHDSKEKLKKELDQVGISESTLFPEIDKTASAIKRRYENFCPF